MMYFWISNRIVEEPVNLEHETVPAFYAGIPCVNAFFKNGSSRRYGRFVKKLKSKFTGPASAVIGNALWYEMVWQSQSLEDLPQTFRTQLLLLGVP